METMSAEGQVTSRRVYTFTHISFYRSLRSSCDSVVKALDFYPSSLGSSPVITHMSHWWHQEVRVSRQNVPVCQ